MGMQTVQESLQAEYDELYEHYQVSNQVTLVLIDRVTCCHYVSVLEQTLLAWVPCCTHCCCASSYWE